MEEAGAERRTRGSDRAVFAASIDVGELYDDEIRVLVLGTCLCMCREARLRERARARRDGSDRLMEPADSGAYSLI